MKPKTPSKRNPMAGSLQHAVNRQQVIPDRKRKRVKAPPSDDFEYAY